MQLHIPNRSNSTTAFAVNSLFIKLQISVHVGIEFYITEGAVEALLSAAFFFIFIQDK